MLKNIAIQGDKGSFHELAALNYFGEDSGELVYCQTFIDVFKALETGKADCVLVAIGNNRYGDINHVYDILIANYLGKSVSKYWISGEVYINVNHCLLGLSGTKLEDIEEVYSQAPAIVQCFGFIHSQLPNAITVETDDTALSAKLVSKWQSKSKAAIASVQAAKLYGLKVLVNGIQDDKNNITRFLVIEPARIDPIKEADKTSLLLRTTHEPGALVNALGLFARQKLNLSYLQSIPIPNRPFEYRFYVDVDGGLEDPRFVSAIEGMDKLGYQYDILGSYKQASVPKIKN